MKKNMNGFTLVELICVVAIIGMLASMAVPSFQNYIFYSQKKSDVQTAQKIYDAIPVALLDPNAATSFYRTDGSNFCRNVTVERTTPLPATGSYTETYQVRPLIRCNGIPGKITNKGGGKTTNPNPNRGNDKDDFWTKGNNQLADFASAMSDIFETAPKMKFDSGTTNCKINCWYVVFRYDYDRFGNEIPARNRNKDRSNVEIWVGDSTGGWETKLWYRVWPDPDAEYLRGGRIKTIKTTEG